MASSASTAAPGNLGATATGSGRDLQNLDVLRAIAVLSVVVSHLVEVSRPHIPLHRYGAFGVGLFFIHTSLVLMGSLQRRPDTVSFYVRRALRIYPLATLATLLVLAFHAPVSPFHGDRMFVYSAPSWKQLLTHLMLVQNLFSGNMMLYVLWSLPLEVQMYLVLPPLFFFIERYRTLWPLLVLWLALFAVSVREFSAINLNLVFATCFFLPGVMAYVGFRNWRTQLPGWSFPIAVLIAIAVGGRAHNWREAAPVALALGLLLPLFRQLSPGPLTSASWYVARYSYGVYLLHPFCLVLAFHLLPHWPYAAQIVVFCVSTVAAAVAAFHLVEALGIRFGSRLAGRWEARSRRPAGAGRSQFSKSH